MLTELAEGLTEGDKPSEGLIEEDEMSAERGEGLDTSE